jgi:hypothetical protein
MRPTPFAESGPVIPEASVPVSWKQVLAEWPGVDPSRLVDSISLARKLGLLSAVHCSDGENGEFVAWLREGLAGVTRSVTVTFADPRYVSAVVSLLGVLLGDVDYSPESALGGPASVVSTGRVGQHEEWWHTDSTAWRTPNRWTILGLLRDDPNLLDSATSVLPWAEIERKWRGDPVMLEQLAHRAFPWRREYPHLAPISAPICGEVVRWFRPALSDYIDDLTLRVDACHALDEMLKTSSQWYDAVVAPTRVLVFDNHAALHRGPAVKEQSCRLLIRLKVSGTPDQ